MNRYVHYVYRNVKENLNTFLLYHLTRWTGLYIYRKSCN